MSDLNTDCAVLSGTDDVACRSIPGDQAVDDFGCIRIIGIHRTAQHEVCSIHRNGSIKITKLRIAAWGPGICFCSEQAKALAERT